MSSFLASLLSVWFVAFGRCPSIAMQKQPFRSHSSLSCMFATGNDPSAPKRFQKGGFWIAMERPQPLKKCKHPKCCDKIRPERRLLDSYGETPTTQKCKQPEGCEKRAQGGGFCIAHGATKKPSLRAIFLQPSGCLHSPLTPQRRWWVQRVVLNHSEFLSLSRPPD